MITPARVSTSRTVAFALSLLSLVFAATHAAAQGDLPVRLPSGTVPAYISNAEFWRMHESMSEPGGMFSSENFTSNEMTVGQLSTELRARGRTGGAYIGVGPEQNFTYIAALKPDIVFLVDIRRQGIMQHLMFKAVFELSANRSEFIANLFSLPTQPAGARDTSIVQLWTRYVPLAPDSTLFTRNLGAIYNQLAVVRGMRLSSADSASLRHVYHAFFAMGPGISYTGSGRTTLAAVIRNPVSLATLRNANFVNLTTITDAAQVPRSFLATEADFQFIKGLHGANKIVTLVGDFGGPLALRAVADWLRGHGTVVSAFYTSNVEQYLFNSPQSWRSFYSSVATMPLDSGSLFIRPLTSGTTGTATAVPLPTALWEERRRAVAAAYGLASPDPVVQSSAAATASASAPPRPPIPPTPPVVLSSTTSVAQDPNLGSVRGVVRDATGTLLSRVAVLAQGHNIVANSADDGSFTIPNVPAGLFTLSARRIGYTTILVNDVRVAAGQQVVVNLRMNAAPIVVSGVVSSNPQRAVSAPMAITAGGRIQLCPMIPFLDAFSSGRVTVYTHATGCIR